MLWYFFVRRLRVQIPLWGLDFSRQSLFSREPEGFPIACFPFYDDSVIRMPKTCVVCVCQGLNWAAASWSDEKRMNTVFQHLYRLYLWYVTSAISAVVKCSIFPSFGNCFSIQDSYFYFLPKVLLKGPTFIKSFVSIHQAFELLSRSSVLIFCSLRKGRFCKTKGGEE